MPCAPETLKNIPLFALPDEDEPPSSPDRLSIGSLRRASAVSARVVIVAPYQPATYSLSLFLGRIHVLKRIVVCCSLATFCYLGLANGEDFSFNCPRPLMVLSTKISETYGLLVNYEDAPYDSVSELDAEKHPVTGITILTPRWRPITFHMLATQPTFANRSNAGEADAALDAGDALATMQTLLNQYNSSGNPGKFMVVREHNSLHIEQISRNVNGRLQPFEPVSNTVVTWESKSETCQQAVSDLFTAMRTQRGIGLAEGSVPMETLLLHHCEIQGGSLTVRQIIEAIISGLRTDPITRQKLSSDEGGYTWQLVYDPNWNKYFLNLEGVRLHNPSPVIDVTAPSSPALGSPSSGRLQRRAIPPSAK